MSTAYRTHAIKATAAGVAVVAALSLGGCGGQQAAPQEEQAPAQEEQAPADEQAGDEAKDESKSTVPAAFKDQLFYANGTWVYADGTKLGTFTIDGHEIEPTAQYGDKANCLMGPFSDGRAIAMWKTSDYDEEWQEEINERMHAAVVDAQGNVVKNLEDIVSRYTDTDATMFLYDNDVYFSEGIAMISIVSEEGNDLIMNLVAIDTQGNELFAISEKDEKYTDGALATRCQFHDGVAQVSKDVFVDTAGNVVFDARTTDMKYVASAGKGLYAEAIEWKNPGFSNAVDTTVYDSTGAVVFDVEDLKGSKYSGARNQLLGSGLTLVWLTEESPNDTGKTHTWSGIYDIAAKKWILEPVRKSITAGPVRDGVFALEVSDNIQSGGMGEDAEGSADTGGLGNGIGLMRTDGTWAVEPHATGAFTDRDEDSDVSYLGGGFWQYFNEDVENYCTLVKVSGKSVDTFDPSFKAKPTFAYFPED